MSSFFLFFFSQEEVAMGSCVSLQDCRDSSSALPVPRDIEPELELVLPQEQSRGGSPASNPIYTSQNDDSIASCCPFAVPHFRIGDDQAERADAPFATHRDLCHLLIFHQRNDPSSRFPSSSQGSSVDASSVKDPSLYPLLAEWTSTHATPDIDAALRPFGASMAESE